MNKTRRIIGVVLLGWLGLGVLAAAAGETAGPQEVIRETSQRLHQILNNNRDKLLNDPGYVYGLADRVFVPHVDMDRVSSLVLGRYWRTATPDQRRAFAQQFKRLLVRTYATALRELGNWDIRFLPLRMSPRGDHALVKTQLLREGAPPLPVDYSMRLKDGRWLAYDVKIDGISLITNYRSSFSRLIQAKGIGGLIRELSARNDAKSPSTGRALAHNARTG